jgi:Ser/Thr protein kinase RdoA (MazF antagonist)
VTAHEGGHINDSFVVATSARRYLLQRINTRVFPAPELVMENIVAVTRHIAQLLAGSNTPDAGRRVLTVIATRDGAWLARDASGDAWRMYVYIERAVSRATARDAEDARVAARAFGNFQHQLNSYAGPPLHVTIPGFHDTVRRFTALQRARAVAKPARLARAADLLELAAAQDRLITFFEAARAHHMAIERIAHHDAKIANLLFDETTGEPLCVVDLDTTMPGLSLYDFGDLVRSMVSSGAEDDPDPIAARADPERFRAVLQGYLEGVDDLLVQDERWLLPPAAEAMVFEQGVRFLTDYLEGDVYYKISRPEQNLDRSTAQFELLASLMAEDIRMGQQ